MLRVISLSATAFALVLTASADMGRRPANDTPGISLPGTDAPLPAPAPLPSVPAGRVVNISDSGPVLDAIWSAAEALPHKKQTRLKPNMMTLVAKSGDPALVQSWSQRLGITPSAQPAEYTDFAAKDAADALAAHGWDGFIDRARTRAEPFNIGRPEKMAAGVRLADSPEQARDLMTLMFSLAKPDVTRGGGGDTFEQADFGHVLSELSMERCDLDMFDRAVALTAMPDNLRYAFWRARITGDIEALASRVQADANTDDTSHVRQAMDGYGAVLSRGYCAE